MSTILSDRLKSLTPNSSVLSILEDQPIYGFHRTSLSFKNILEGSSESINYKYGKGQLRYSLDSGDLTINPSKRFVKDGFIFANNPAYDNSNSVWDFPRMYYKPANVDELRDFGQDGNPVYVLSDFAEGGYIYKKVDNSENFSIVINGVKYDQDDFEIVSVGSNSWAVPDLNGDGSVTGGLDSDVFSLVQSVRDNGIANDSDVFGYSAQNSTPTAAVTRSFYEMIMQFSAYPSATVFGTSEIISNPGQFSVLIYDAKRDSSFQLTISNLATVLSSIAAISNGAICGDGVVNITAPMLTSGQIQNFFVNATGSSLTSEGAVSTEAFLEFLTAFGPCVSDDSFDPALDSQMSYHSGYDSEIAGEGIVVQNFLQGNLGGVVPNTTSNSSFGEIDFTSKPVFINYSSGSALTSFLFGDGFSENLNYADIFWRLHTYHINDFLPHTSNGGTLYSGDESASIPNRDMPAFNKVVIAGPDFDHILTNSNLPGEAVIFEDIFKSEALYENTSSMSAFETVEFVDSSELGGNTSQTPSWHSGYSYTNDFTRLNDRSDVSSKYLSANARLEVTVKGFVTCESGDEPIVPLFLRATGTTDGAYDIYPTTDYVYALGVVNMGSNSEWDEENQVNYQEFSFTRDFYEYECFYSDSITQGAISCPSQTNEGQPLYLGIFGIQFRDNAKKVVITGVKYRYKNQSLV